MNTSHRLLCESWVEKRPEVGYVALHGTPSRKNSLKWKTRYAMLIVSCETRTSEIRFYQKKPRSYTEITDDVVKLQPWQYIVDVPTWIVDKGRPHVLRLRLLPESVVPGQNYRIQIAYQSSEETTAWMRCIQNQTKLTSGIQGHSFGVVAEESSAAARIGVSGKHCLLFVGPEQVILANKTDRSVVCVWPFQTIRSYASDDDRRLVVEAGRCAPLGEGVYSFRTRENDDNALFDLFDHYIAQAAEQLEKPKKGKKERSDVTSPSQSKSAPPGVSSAESSRKTRKAEEQEACLNSSSSSEVVMEDRPPAKPPLPEDRATLPLVCGQAQSSEALFQQNMGNTSKEPQTKLSPSKKKNKGSPDKKKYKEIKRAKDASSKNSKDRDSVSKGIYDLDKLLYSLESSIRLSQGNLSEKETIGYASPTSKEALEGMENLAGTDPVDPYAVNTIKAGSLPEPHVALHTPEPSVTDDALRHVAHMPPHPEYQNTKIEAKVDKTQEDIGSSNSATESRETTKPPKPKVAPKPPSIKVRTTSSNATPSATKENSPQNVGPPYAKVNTGKKTKV